MVTEAADLDAPTIAAKAAGAETVLNYFCRLASFKLILGKLQEKLHCVLSKVHVYSREQVYNLTYSI